MKKTILTCGMALLSAVTIFGADVSFTGESHDIISIVPEKNTGLNNIYVAYDSSKLESMVISGVSPAVKVSRYSNLGGGYAEPVTVSYQNGQAIVLSPEGNMGYIIEDNGQNAYVWVVNYLPYKISLKSVNAAHEQDCFSTNLDIDGKGDAIHYFTIDGRQMELSRDIKIDYSTLLWDDEASNYTQINQSKVLKHLTSTVSISPAIYCNSKFVVTGDRFMEQWGIGLEVESPLIQANGLEVHSIAEQINLPAEDPDADPSNQIRTESQGMGGSAPAVISFQAFTTDAVIHNEWQIAKDQSFENIEYRYNEQNIEYTFTEEGTFYVRFVGSNAEGTCQSVGDPYIVSIGASDLRIPNAFTPDGDGVNDEWKVGYRSLLNFHCSIFDRYGNEIFSFSDPSIGWDGKHNGKLVKPGVYFYVIEATGSDGKKYKKGGDINLIKSKRYTTDSSAD